MLAAGVKFGPYEVLSLLASGGMGEVYRARDSRLDRIVALKILPASSADNQAHRQRMQREARAISALQHPHICTLYDVGQQDGADFMVMELLEGETLASLLSRNHLSLEQILTYGTEIADALDAAKHKGIIHRDLKPGNIFITSHGECKVLDFGLAKVDEDSPDAATMTQPDVLTSPGVAVGTVAYMSPEQARGEPLDGRTDIFSLGTVLYEMAAGKPPFAGKTSAVTFKAILDMTPPPPSHSNKTIPPKLDDVIGKCLEKDRDLRYQSAAELRSDLKRIKRDSDSQRVSTASEQEPARKHRLVWPIAAATIAMLLVLAAVSGVVYKRAATPRASQVNLQIMKMMRLTDNGKVGKAAISLDGRYVAYSLREPPYTLSVRQVSPESTVQVLPSSPEHLKWVTFSPDGGYLYFVRANKCYLIPTLGGTPRLVIEGTYGGVDVSPDGTKLAFVHEGPPASQLIVANQDGTDQHVVIEYDRASGTEFNTTGAPSWSPDGKFVAMPAIRNAQYGLNIYPANGGSPTVLPLPGAILRAVWLPDQNGLVVDIASTPKAPSQIWLQPYPEGTLQRITNDLDAYQSISISSNGTLLSTVQIHDSFTISVGPASQPDEGTTIRSGKSDGAGLAWIKDGALLSQNMEFEFSSLSPDGMYRNPLFKADGVFAGEFSVCRDGRLIVSGKDQILLTDTAGKDQKQITSGAGQWGPDCSPDGHFVIYTSRAGATYSLMRVSTNGGSPTVLGQTKHQMDYARYSPDAHQIACVEWSDKGTSLVIRNSQTGAISKSFDVPEGVDVPRIGYSRGLQWTPDGRTLTYPGRGRGGSLNLWSQLLSGGPARQITHFREDVVAYDWSPDGKQVALTRSATTSDVVLISNFH